MKTETLWTIIVLSIVLISCRQTSTAAPTITPVPTTMATPTKELAFDNSFLTGQPCAAPCWYNLKLDQSNEQKIRTTISQLPFVAQDTIREEDSSFGGKMISFDCTYETGEKCGRIEISDNKLKAISIAQGYELTFKMVVDQLGSPSQIGRIRYLDETGCSTSLYWTQITVRGKELGSGCPPESSQVESGIQVIAISYSVPDYQLCYACTTWPGFLNP